MYSYLVFTLTYTFWSAICFIMDIYGSDTLVSNKIGTKDRNKIKKLYIKILPTMIFNIYIITLPILYLDYSYTDINSDDFKIDIAFIHLVLSVIISEVLFYTCHRISHHRFIYKRFHKKHHELKEPIGMGALYSHPLDALFGAIIPDGIGIYLLGAHNYTIYFWIVLTVSFTILVAHSNFKDLSEYHDDHHRLTNYNYGNGFFMDKIFGTEITSNRNRKKTLIKVSEKIGSEVKIINNKLGYAYKRQMVHKKIKKIYKNKYGVYLAQKSLNDNLS